MLGESGFAISIFEVTQVFSESDIEGPARLSCELHVTGRACNMVSSKFQVFIFWGGMWWFPISTFFYVFFCGVSDLSIGVLEGLNNVSCFSAAVGESGPGCFF